MGNCVDVIGGYLSGACAYKVNLGPCITEERNELHAGLKLGHCHYSLVEMR